MDDVMTARGTRRALLTLLVVTVAATAAHADWPQFRGPDGSGVVPDGRVPLRWSEDQHVRWKTPIHGRAWSSPVVLGSKVWLTTATEDGTKLFAVGIDRDTGRVVHDLKLFDVAEPQFIHAFNTHASPTPVAEHGRVCVTFGSPGTACLDAESGRVLWTRRDLECNHFRGAGSSPIIHGDLLIMHFDGSDHQYVVALDKHTGRTVWRRDRSIDFKDLGPDGKPEAEGDMRKAFATPHVITVDGRAVLISLGAKAGYAYDVETGEELWRVEERTNHSASTRPVVGHGLVYFPTGFPRGQLLAVRPGGRGDVTETHVAWRVSRGVPSKPSILLVDDLIYMVTDAGVASAVDAKTGEHVWTARVGGTFSASPVAVGRHVYFFDEDGKTTVIATGRTYTVVAENTLDDGFMASPALAGGAWYLRTKTHLYRIGE
jgi:outer membrane protein assembly factor BamB